MNAKRFFQTFVTMTLILVIAMPISVTAASTNVLYVKPGGLASGSCDSWANSCELQYALNRSVSGQEIWVAAGVYKPGAVRTDTFQLKSGVGLYGGFAGTETVREQRDWQANVTILSGDIDNNDINEDGNHIAETTASLRGANSYHVLITMGLGADSILDGFTVTAGQANAEYPDNNAAGMYNDNSNPTLAHLTFTGNFAQQGGGMRNYYSNPTMTDITFTGNYVTASGGGLANDYSAAVLTDVRFIGNHAGDLGGGLVEDFGTSTLTQVTFLNNTSENVGGGMGINNWSHPILTNVAFSGNTSVNRGGALFVWKSELTLTNASFDNNATNDIGGAIHFLNSGNVVMNNVTFTGNTANRNGGGIHSENSNLFLDNATFSGNSAHGIQPNEGGGGIYNVYGSLTLTGVSLTGNSADWGGGAISSWWSPGILTNVIFSNNSAGWGAGGMLNHEGNLILKDVGFFNNTGGDNGGGFFNNYNTNAILENVIFFGNIASWGGGIWNAGSVTLTNVTLAGNVCKLHIDGPIIDGSYGGGIYNHHGFLNMNNTILWGNTADNGPQIFNQGGGVSITYSDIQGSGGGLGGNVDADPLFVNPTDGNLHLQEGSPVIDSGTNVNCPVADFDGALRPYDGDYDGVAVCDMGAYEYEKPLNHPPFITNLFAPATPIRIGQSIDATVVFSDPDVGDTHTATWGWGDGTITTVPANVPSVMASHVYAYAGVYTVTTTITDAAGESDTEIFQYVVAYDPNGEFVSGAGIIHSPLGAYTADPSLEGMARFGFVSKYQKGANVPAGNTEFHFKIANLDFKSTSYQWLVVAGSKAQFKGTGTINGMGDYGFMLTAIDGSPDKFRIKIWDKATGEIIYDNLLGASDTADPSTAIQGGSIVIHK